jgi:integrase/recombinase XerD
MATQPVQGIISGRSQDVEVQVRKHSGDCRFANEVAEKQQGKCRCPKYIYIKATQKRQSARTRSWATAEIEAQKIRDRYDPKLARIAELERKKEAAEVLIEDAITAFIANKEKNNIRSSTIRSYKSPLDSFKGFAKQHNLNSLHEITPTHLSEWRLTWNDKTVSSMKKKRAQMRTFFRFCVEVQKWISPHDNPINGLTAIRGQNRIAAVAFMADQYEALLDATYLFEDSLLTWNRTECAGSGMRLRALIQLMRWSGLSIRDAVTLERARIDQNGVLKIRRGKLDENTRIWVIVPLPPKIVEELRALVSPNDRYFFWSGINAASRTGNFSRDFLRLSKLVKWPRPLVDVDNNPVKPHSHMLRHTFAYHYLQSRQGDIIELSRLLGHTSVRTTEKYYRTFVPDESDELNETVRKSWAVLGAPGFEKQRPASVRQLRQRRPPARRG